MILLVVLYAGVAAGCGDGGKSSAYADYLKIKNSGVTGKELLDALTGFEVKNTGNFESKVDLGSYYLLTQDYERSEVYLTRAESVLGNAAKTKESKESTAILYGSLAHLRLMREDYGPALEYVNKALKLSSKNHAEYEYLKARILFSDGKKEDALKQFETAYKNNAEKIAVEDIDAMIKLYTGAENYEAAVPFVELFFVRGTYYPGFGVIASTVYEGAGDYGKSVLCAYLDIEYYQSKVDLSEEEVRGNIARVKETLIAQNHFDEARDDVILIEGSAEPFAVSPSDWEPFFVREYLLLERLIRSGAAPSRTVQHYLGYENFFKHSPAYYLNSWLALTALDQGNKQNYVPVLEKLIALKPVSGIDAQAREWIGETLGLSKSQSANLLMPFEVNEILETFSRDRNSAGFERIYALYELPDNAYVLNALVLVKNRRDTLFLRELLDTRRKTAAGRLRERIDYILQ
ncbi:hypothetical protein AGMMS50268_25710 [Spirochaetia bacterium]|nr:hypothetical protein AGMMS50268_25710 [Spirochaetia bacterium]